jgi:transcriptional regulator with XRE-family HTH domain
MLTTGIRIKKLRELRGYSQNYMAKKLAISQEQYSYLETKQKTITDEHIKTIAALLGVKEDYLKTFDPQNIIDNSINDQPQAYLDIQNQIIKSHESERKYFLILIDKLKEELKEMKKKLGGGVKDFKKYKPTIPNPVRHSN